MKKLLRIKEKEKDKKRDSSALASRSRLGRELSKQPSSPNLVAGSPSHAIGSSAASIQTQSRESMEYNDETTTDNYLGSTRSIHELESSASSHHSDVSAVPHNMPHTINQSSSPLNHTASQSGRKSRSSTLNSNSPSSFIQEDSCTAQEEGTNHTHSDSAVDMVMDRQNLDEESRVGDVDETMATIESGKSDGLLADLTIPVADTSIISLSSNASTPITAAHIRLNDPISENVYQSQQFHHHESLNSKSSLSAHDQSTANLNEQKVKTNSANRVLTKESTPPSVEPCNSISTESKNKMSGDFLNFGRKIIHKNSQSFTNQSIFTLQSKSTYVDQSSSKSKYIDHQISTLIDSNWDSAVGKSGWVNRITESSDPKLFRLELKGSSLLVHKPASELSFAKSLTIQTSSTTQDSDISMFPNSEFVKSTASLKGSGEDSYDDTVSETMIKSADGNVDEQSPSLTDNDDDNHTAVFDGNDEEPKDAGVDNRSTTPIENNQADESALLTRAIDEYAIRSQIKIDLQSHMNNEGESEINDLNNIESVEMSQKKSTQSVSQAKTHLPFIIHDLYYQSPSCPHPKLAFDISSGLILRGTLEAVCHTILFYPSDRMAEKLIEILPLVGSLIDPLVYFQRFLDHFTDSANLKAKNIKISDMEVQIMLTRLKKVIEVTVEKFYGSLLDNEIFQLLSKLTESLSKKSVSFISSDEMIQLSNTLQKRHASLDRLVRFQVSDDPSGAFEQSDLVAGEKFITLSTESLAFEIHAIDSHFMKYWSPRSDRSSIFLRLEIVESSFNYWKYNPLQFIPSIHTHYLGRLLAYHLFEDPTTSVSAAKRALVLMKWIHLGSALCEQGDMVSWLGIAIVMCSQPVLRLSETWGRVDKTSLQTISKKWAPVVFEIRKNELFGTNYPTEYQTDNTNLNDETFDDDAASKNIRIMITNKVGELYAKEDAIPYFGELFTPDLSIKQESSKPDLFQTDFIKSYCAYLETVDWNLKQWDEYYSSIDNQPGIESKFEFIDSNNDPAIIGGCKDAQLSSMLKTVIAYNSSNGPFPLNYFMTLSVIVEPPYVGQFARFHGTSRSPLFLGTYASILFPKTLPYYQIYDRDELIGAIGGAGMVGNAESDKKYRNRNVFLKRVRDLFNVGNDEFKLKDNSIIFKTIQDESNAVLHDEKNNENFRTNEASKKSRPSSILFEPPSKSKHLSTVSTGSFNFDDYILSYQSYLKDVMNDSNSQFTREQEQVKSDADKDNKCNDSNLQSRNVNIVTTAATSERLMDLLVLTASVFGTHIQDSDLKTYSEKTSKDSPICLQMDNAEFTNTFFATYRVFCTTKQLVESLQKRFEGSKSAALSIAKYINNQNDLSVSDFVFPEWDSSILDNDETRKEINWLFVIQIQLGVIESTLILVSDYFKHFMDDIVTKATFDSFLEMMDHTIVFEWPAIFKWLKQYEDAEVVQKVVQLYKSLQRAYKQVRNICIRKSYTPLCEPMGLDFSGEINSVPQDMHLPSSIDIDEIISYVNKLDGTIMSSMSLISSDDWVDTFEIMQMLITRSQLSMFNYEYQDSTTHPELIIISNIYHWILTLNDGDNFKTVSANNKIIKKFSLTIKSIFKLYQRVQSFILSEIVDANISIDERIDRMSTILKMLQICRIRMRNLELFNDSAKEDTTVSPYIPSFIESVLVNTIMLPESRFFSHAWKLASAQSKQETDFDVNNIETLLPELSAYEIQSIQSGGPLSICPGWILGRIVEIACFVPNMDIDNTSLINFDKNRFVHHCILKIYNLQSKPKKNISPYLTEFSFLFEYEGDIPDLKTIYEVSSTEKSNEKLEKCSIFKEHINEQIQLLKLEERKRDLLVKQRVKDDMNMMKLSSGINTFAANITEPLPSIDKDELSSISGSIAPSAYTETNSVRDNDLSSIRETASIATSTSTAVNTNEPSFTQSIQSVQTTQSNLTVTSNTSSNSTRLSASSTFRSNKTSSSSSSSNKFKFGFFKSRPFSSLSIGNTLATSSVLEKRNVHVNELPKTEQMSMVMSNSKSKPYITIFLKDVSIFPTYRTPNSFTINVTTPSSTSHFEYTFQTATENEVSEWIYKLSYAKKHWFYSKSLNTKYSNFNPNLTFGAPLDFVCERDNRSIPMIVEKIFSEIELRGLEEVGIYRKSASLSVVQKIKDSINKFGDYNMENVLVFDIHNLTGCVKAYLRELPDPLINDELVNEMLQVRDFSKDTARFTVYKDVLSKLPIYNYCLIKRFTRHMKLIEDYESQNRMTSYNLATIMGGSLAEGCRPETISKSFGLMNFICEDWILNYDTIFE